MKAIIRLSAKSGLYPKCIVLRDVQKTGTEAVAGGHFGEVWKGLFRDHVIAMKILKVYASSDIDKFLKASSMCLNSAIPSQYLCNRYSLMKQSSGGSCRIPMFSHFMGFTT